MCVFCERLSEIKEVHKIAQSWDTEERLATLGKYLQELTVAIVDRTWYQKRGKKSASRTTHYRNQGIGFKLNYCPECGRKLVNKRGINNDGAV